MLSWVGVGVGVGVGVRSGYGSGNTPDNAPLSTQEREALLAQIQEILAESTG